MITYCYKVTRSQIHKSISQLNPDFIWSYFVHKDMRYNLRKGPILGLPKTHSFYYGTNAIYFRKTKIKLKTLEILIADV